MLSEIVRDVYGLDDSKKVTRRDVEEMVSMTLSSSLGIRHTRHRLKKSCRIMRGSMKREKEKVECYYL